MAAFSIARNLAVVGIAVSTGMFVSFGLQYTALERLKVNGPIYEQIVYGKDLIADILPPPRLLADDTVATEPQGLVDERSAGQG